MSRNKAFIAFTVVVILLFAILKMRTGEGAYFNSGYRPVMGTFANVISIAPDFATAQEAVERAFDEFKKIEKLMSYHKSDSELSRINQNAYRQDLKVSDVTLDVIKKAIQFSELTDGAFDITVAPLVELYKKAEDINSIPQMQEIEDARSKIGFQKLFLDAEKKTIRFSVEGMKIDLGGIAKGYAIDSAVREMKRTGATGGMVDIGGDIRVFGEAPGSREYWRIGLQDPNIGKYDLSEDKYVLVLKVNNLAVATSGDYRRFYLVGGREFSHIFDTRIGMSSNELGSVSVIADTALAADALATAVSVMGREKGLQLIEELVDTEAVLLPSDNKKIIKTSGAEKYLAEIP